jgi:hypothetical protein
MDNAALLYDAGYFITPPKLLQLAAIEIADLRIQKRAELD